jgi:hypothetical protein
VVRFRFQPFQSWGRTPKYPLDKPYVSSIGVEVMTKRIISDPARNRRPAFKHVASHVISEESILFVMKSGTDCKNRETEGAVHLHVENT